MEFMRENFHGAQLKVRRTNSGHESKHLNCIADCTVTSFGEVSFIGVYIPLPPYIHRRRTTMCWCTSGSPTPRGSGGCTDC